MSCLFSVILTVVMAIMVHADIGKLSCTCGVSLLGIHVHVIHLNHNSAIDTYIFIFLYSKGRVLVIEELVLISRQSVTVNSAKYMIAIVFVTWYYNNVFRNIMVAYLIQCTSHIRSYDVTTTTGADPGFQVRGSALKIIAVSGARRENFWGYFV